MRRNLVAAERPVNIDEGAVSKGMSAVMPSLKCARFTRGSGESRSLTSLF